MLLIHARALAHTEIYRCSEPSVKYHKAAVVADETGDDWEPIQSPPSSDVSVPQVVGLSTATAESIGEAEDLTNGYDCGCAGVPVTPPSPSVPKGGVDAVEP